MHMSNPDIYCIYSVYIPPPYSKFKDIIEEFMRQKLSQLHEWGVLTNILLSVIRKDTILSCNVLKWVAHVSPCRQEVCMMRILGREAKLEKNYNTKLVWCWEVGCNTMWQTLSQLLFFRAWAQQESISLAMHSQCAVQMLLSTLSTAAGI